MTSLTGWGAAALSSRRSASRCRALVVLDDHGGFMAANELAVACGWDLWRLRAVVFGDNDSFSVERSPFALGQVILYETPHGAFFALTDEGRREVEQLRSEPHWSRGRGRHADLG